MKNVRVEFQFNDNDTVPIGYKKIPGRLIFDFKMLSLTRKVRYVVGAHKTDPPKESVYFCVVSRESVRLAFLVATLNDVDILAADI